MNVAARSKTRAKLLWKKKKEEGGGGLGKAQNFEKNQIESKQKVSYKLRTRTCYRDGLKTAGGKLDDFSTLDLPFDSNKGEAAWRNNNKLGRRRKIERQAHIELCGHGWKGDERASWLAPITFHTSFFSREVFWDYIVDYFF